MCTGNKQKVKRDWCKIYTIFKI